MGDSFFVWWRLLQAEILRAGGWCPVVAEEVVVHGGIMVGDHVAMNVLVKVFVDEGGNTAPM